MRSVFITALLVLGLCACSSDNESSGYVATPQGQGGVGGSGGTTPSGSAGTSAGGTGSTGGSSSGTSGSGGSAGSIDNPLTNPADGLPAGNPDGKCSVPADAMPESISTPTTVVGNGTKESCTASAVVQAVAKGGIITFNCGPDPVVITLTETAKVFNDASSKVVIDGGGKVTLSGGGKVRILYMNTCDQNQHWTTPHCNNQETPQLTVQNITLADGNSKAETEYDGGGAIWVRGGRVKIVNARFFGNTCASEGQDVGGGAVRVFDQYEGKPVYIVNSTFGGKDGMGNSGSNGGAISSIGTSYTLINSLFSFNRATGKGMNGGTPGGGNGGAIYNDGNTFTLSLCGTRIENNTAAELGGAIFYVSNNLTGAINIDQSVIQSNSGRGNGPYKDIYAEIRDDKGVNGYTVTNSTIE